MKHKICLRAGAAALGVAATMGVIGVAAAAPNYQPLVDTTCSYNQVTAALGAQSPLLAQELTTYPMAQARLQKFLSMSTDQREQMVDNALAAHPDAQSSGTQQQQILAVLLQVASTCSNY